MSRGVSMAAFFSSLGKTVLAGLVLVIALVFVMGAGGRLGEHQWWMFVMRWLHIMAGIMWVGLLYYFNFVQTPSMPKIPDEHKPAIGKVIAPAALFWFRWAALATVIFGLMLAGMKGGGYLVNALTLTKGFQAIGIGMWLALIMAINVWFVIWPNQKKVLGIVVVSPEEKASAAKLAGLVSRINTMLSIPMLFCMVAQQNGGL